MGGVTPTHVELPRIIISNVMHICLNCILCVYYLVGVAGKLGGGGMVKSNCPGINFRKVGNHVTVFYMLQ